MDMATNAPPPPSTDLIASKGSIYHRVNFSREVIGTPIISSAVGWVSGVRGTSCPSLAKPEAAFAGCLLVEIIRFLVIAVKVSSAVELVGKRLLAPLVKGVFLGHGISLPKSPQPVEAALSL